MQESPAPGHYPDLSNDAYHSSEGISKSHLDDIGGASPMHYWEARINPDREPREKTPALILGDAIHKAVLEPDLMETNFVTAPTSAPKRPSSRQRDAKKPSLETLEAIDFWDSFNAAAAGKIILDGDDMKMIKDARDAVHRHPFAGPLFRGGQAEQSFYAIDERTGALIKCRTDYLKTGMVVDLKSSENAGPKAFMNSAETYRYYVQAAWYPHVIESAGFEPIKHFVFVAIEKVRPFAIGVYYAVEEYVDDFNTTRRPLAEARHDMNRDLDLILKHRADGTWPDYGAAPRPLLRPGWTRPKAA